MTDISTALKWAGVELRHLVTLRTVADVGSLAGAARRLGYSQPAVSQQLATLERLVEARLVERRAGAREVTLTEAGRIVLLHGGAMLARAQAADADLRSLRDGATGTLRLGTIPSVGARIVPHLIGRYSSRAPGVDIELVEDGDDRRLLEQVESGQLDLAFVLLPLPDGPFDAAELLRDRYVVVASAESPLGRGVHALTLKQIGDLPLIVCSHSRAPEAMLGAHGIAARIRFRVDDNETLIGLAAAGLGAALVPQLTVDPNRHDVVRLELATKLPPRILGLAWHRDRHRTAAADALIDTAREVCAEFEDDSAARAS